MLCAHFAMTCAGCLTRANWTVCCCWWWWSCPLGVGRRSEPDAVRATAAAAGIAVLGSAPTDLHVTAPLAELAGKSEAVSEQPSCGNDRQIAKRTVHMMRYLVTMVVGPLAKPFLPAAESSSTTLTSSLLGESGSLLMVTTLVPAKTAKRKQLRKQGGTPTQ